jgi:hypothetical protein
METMPGRESRTYAHVRPLWGHVPTSLVESAAVANWVRRQAGGLVIRGLMVMRLLKSLTLIRVVPVGQAGRPDVPLQGSDGTFRVLTGGAGHNAGTKAPT